MKKIITGSVSSILCLTACSLLINKGPAQAVSQKIGVANSEPMAANNEQYPASQWWQQTTDLSQLSHQTPTTQVVSEATPASRYQAEPISQPAQTPRFNKLASEQPDQSPTPILNFKQNYSTTAGDLTSTVSSTDTDYAGIPTPEKAPQQISQFDVEGRIPGANFLGIGANIGDNKDVLDLAILSKIRFLTFGSEDRPLTLSGRPSLAFSNGIVDIRLPATVEFKQVTLDTGEAADRYTPYAGAGFAISLDKDSDSEFDFMLTGGMDYLLSDAFTLTAMVNLLFLDDVDVEGQFGVGFNF